MNNETLKTTFYPGGKWVYYKIYMSPFSSDKILTRTVYPLKNILIQQEVIEQWFFVRYADPDPHIRLRFKVTKTGNLSILIRRLKKALKPYLKDDQIHQIQIDTYYRETERYGIISMAHCENIFHADSNLVMKTIKNESENENNSPGWMTGFRIVIRYMDIFGLTEMQRKELAYQAYSAMIKKMVNRDEIIRNLALKYREQRSGIHHTLKPVQKDILEAYLDDFAQQCKPSADAILGLERKGELQVDLMDLVTDLAHMSLNRLFRSGRPSHELLIYNFLFRYYKSHIAKQLIHNKTGRNEPKRDSSV